MDTLDRIKGSLLGGAAGDALGYPVEFVPDHAIRDFYGPEGITAYRNGQGWISDDTQMTLFTAAGILSGDGFSGVRHRVAAAYQDWLITQRHYQQQPSPDSTGLMALPQLYARRAPGLTCLLALETREKEPQAPEDYTAEPLNDSKGCGGVMRVAPLALRFRLGDNYGGSLSALDREGAQLAAITHGHSLGYMPAAAMTHILARILEGRLSLEDITADTIRTMEELYAGDEHLRELTGLLSLAAELAASGGSDSENILRLGQGWVAEEALAVALYCTLRHQDDFSAGIIAAVNHSGDSDSTGAITGNLLGAWTGFHAIESRWTEHLELSDILLRTAEALNAAR